MTDRFTVHTDPDGRSYLFGRNHPEPDPEFETGGTELLYWSDEAVDALRAALAAPAQPVRGDGPGIEELELFTGTTDRDLLRRLYFFDAEIHAAATQLRRFVERAAAAPPATSGERWGIVNDTCPSCGAVGRWVPNSNRGRTRPQCVPCGWTPDDPAPAASPEPDGLSHSCMNPAACVTCLSRRPAPEAPATADRTDER